LNRTQLQSGESWLEKSKNDLLRGTILFLATLTAYLPALLCRYIWDDDVYVTGNPLLTAPDGLWRIWFSFDSPSQYFPLVYTTMRAEHALWALAPVGYHLVNIVLHGVNALLVWRVLKRMDIAGAWGAAAIFALHPVQVESVAWVTELKNVEMGFFFLLTLVAWIEFLDAKGWRAGGYYAVSLLLFALALFSKTTACTLPAALLLICWLRGERIGWRRVAEVMPYLAMGVGMGLLTVWWERYHQGTQGKMFTMGLADRAVIAGRNVWFYLDKLVWPAKLTFSYPRWRLSAADPLDWSWLVALCLAGAWAYLWRRREGRGIFAAGVYFIATLSPVLGVLMLYTFRYTYVADHYQYLACIGPIALLCAGMAKVTEREPKTRGGIVAAGLAVLCLLGVLTFRQCLIYRDDETIWRDTLAKNPGSLMGQFNLANGLMRDGSFAESLTHYDRAVEIDPAFVDARCNRADLLAHMGRLREATEDYEAAMQLEPDNAMIQNGYGVVLGKTGKPAEAVAHLAEAVRLAPHWGLAEKNLADALAAGGDFAGALPHYENIARMFPDEPQAHMALGHVYAAIDKPAEAISEYQEAVRLAPESAEGLTRLAWLLVTADDPKLRDSGEAVKLAGRACELTHGESGVPLNTLAAAYAAEGRLDEAVVTSRRAIEAAAKAGDKVSAAEFEKQMGLYEEEMARSKGDGEPK